MIFCNKIIVYAFLIINFFTLLKSNVAVAFVVIVVWQRVQYENREFNSTNIVLFLTNQVADIL